MGCDYYIKTDLVIEYEDINGIIRKIIIEEDIKQCWLYENEYDYDSNDDDNTNHLKCEEALGKIIDKNTYIEILYENEEWVKLSYKTNYSKTCNRILELSKLIKVYKDYSAWER